MLPLCCLAAWPERGNPTTPRDEVPAVAHPATDRPFCRSPRLALLLAAGALSPSGCGLSEYTGHMSSESVRVQAWDQESQLLGIPITMPPLPKKDGKAQHWDAFLRLPQGVNDTAVMQPKPNETLAQLYGPLAQYQGNGKFGIQNAYLGVAVEQKDFAGMVCSQFGVTPTADTVVTIPRSMSLLNPNTTERADGPNADVVLKKRTGEGQQSSYVFYFYEHGKVTVALVFQIKKGTQDAENAMKASLATLGEGPDADANDLMYKKWNTRPQKKWF
jgi:hypothetical protein